MIDLVVTADKVEAFLAAVDQLLTEGLVTMERVEVRAYRARQASPFPLGTLVINVTGSIALGGPVGWAAPHHRS